VRVAWSAGQDLNYEDCGNVFRGMKMAFTSEAASAVAGRHEATGVTWEMALNHGGASAKAGD
jgi:hypothetical protein